MAKIKFTIITLFPEALQPYLDSSMLYKAQNRGVIAMDYLNLRDFGLGPHRSVDDRPYGGGDGMLLRCEPVFAAIESVKAVSPDAEVILPTPIGLTWNQSLARQFAGIETPAESALDVAKLSVSAGQARNRAEDISKSPERVESQESINTKVIDKTALKTPGNSLKQQNKDAEASISTPARHFIILCPHYEGYDERILSIVDHKISLGHYVLTGGELAALIIIDSVTRLLPGVLGGEHSADTESFSAGNNLEYPQYTKPFDFRGMKVPEILLSGNHAAIAKWRAEHQKEAE